MGLNLKKINLKKPEKGKYILAESARNINSNKGIIKKI